MAFFYRDKDFLTQSSKMFGQYLFNTLGKKPEEFTCFWDNVGGNLGPDRVRYIKLHCDQLKLIPIDKMKVELRDGEGLIISHTDDEDIFAQLDWRVSNKGELRGEFLKNWLEQNRNNYPGKTVYEVLNAALNSHQHNSFKNGLNWLLKNLKIFDEDKGLTKSQFGKVINHAIDDILDSPNVEKFEIPKDKEDEKEIKGKIETNFPTFIACLDQRYTDDLRTKLDAPEFQDQECASQRKKAIEALLDYRDALFTETGIKGKSINLEKIRKSDKCRFAEEMIEELMKSEPSPGQDFKDYINTCIQNAEQKLSQEQRGNWPKGVISHRLRDIVSNMKDYKPEPLVVNALQ
ncbi:MULTISPECIES: hypothetical protein [Legionella]|uniref:Uncharacterized protein n=1 Tax=Legionella resiliens TaxID=2905958 RepID=A0ABS8X430_9GAMM|nr:MULTISPECIES: hypothetical protein [unclassified Legionella]MCE0724361.1 hypothetical protein [Legionella sp. 9fVS26]MCE3533513.1 hypothetical protein [Legionella sp. 8cVS16]QLZ69701.1 hypothetical protein FOLKNPGA_02499 [Legionella sp. PC1000]